MPAGDPNTNRITRIFCLSATTTGLIAYTNRAGKQGIYIRLSRAPDMLNILNTALAPLIGDLRREATSTVKHNRLARRHAAQPGRETGTTIVSTQSTPSLDSLTKAEKR